MEPAQKKLNTKSIQRLKDLEDIYFKTDTSNPINATQNQLAQTINTELPWIPPIEKIGRYPRRSVI